MNEKSAQFSGKNQASQPPLFEQIVEMIRKATGCELNFEDLTGVTYHCPELNLPERLKIHSCSACMFAKSTKETHLDCLQNKIAVNRIALRRRRHFSGMCHLGLNEWVVPFIYNGNVLGIFYFGSVLVTESIRESRNRIKNYCKRRDLDYIHFRKAFATAKKLTKVEFQKLQENIDLLLEIASMIVAQSGLPTENYKAVEGAHRIPSKQIPNLVQAIARYIDRNHSCSITLNDLAKHFHCNPDYASRCFSRHYPEGIFGYLRRIRLDHAVKLLRIGRHSVGEISFLVGFGDQSYFTKIFRETFGCSPGKFRNNSYLLPEDHTV